MEHNLDMNKNIFIVDSDSNIFAGQIFGIQTYKYIFKEQHPEINKEKNITLNKIEKFFKTKE